MAKVVKSKPILTACGTGLVLLLLLEVSAWTEDRDEALWYRNRGFVKQKAGDVEGAIDIYQKALKLRPNFADVHNDVGVLCETQGWFEEAKTAYQHALSVNPPYSLAEYNLALLYEKQAHFPEAIQHLQHFIGHSATNDPWARKAKTQLGAIHNRLVRRKEIRRQKQERLLQIQEGVEQRQREEEAARQEKRVAVLKASAEAERRALDSQRRQIAEEKRDRQEQVQVRREEERLRQAELEAREEERQAALESKRSKQEVLQNGRQAVEKGLNRLFEKGKRAYDQKRYEEAFESFEFLLTLDPENRAAQDYYELIRPFVRKRKKVPYSL